MASTAQAVGGLAALSGKRRRMRVGLVLLVAGTLAAAAASVLLGPSSIPLASIARLFNGTSPRSAEEARILTVLLDVRLPRTVLGLLVGGALAVSGTMLQGLFRNPLADPTLVGVSSGAALGAAGAIVIGSSALPASLAPLASHLVPLAAFAAGLITTMLLYAIATREGRTSIATMLLAGIAIGAFCAAGTGFLIFASNDLQIRDIAFWTLGSLSGATWDKVATAAVLVVPALALAPLVDRGLNALQLGEAEAMHVGIEVERVKRLIVVLVASAVGAAVALSGVIGFVGIVVPHLLRLSVGADNRFLLPASGLLGGMLLLFADLVARLSVAPAELPIGIVTAALGAPFFLWLLVRHRGLLDI